MSLSSGVHTDSRSEITGGKGMEYILHQALLQCFQAPWEPLDPTVSPSLPQSPAISHSAIQRCYPVPFNDPQPPTGPNSVLQSLQYPTDNLTVVPSHYRALLSLIVSLQNLHTMERPFPPQLLQPFLPQNIQSPTGPTSWLQNLLTPFKTPILLQ